MKRMLLLIPVCMLLMGNSDCAPAPSVEKQQAQQTNQLFADMDRAVGMPGIVNYTERRQARRILELRDQELPTYAYLFSMTGEYVFFCNSVGFGIPASVQYTNPQKIADSHSQGGYVTLPQPDPNGLYMPDGLSATYVMCANPDGGEPTPVYVEPQIIVSPFPLGRSPRSPSQAN